MGSSGITADRSGVVTASARILPALICGSTGRVLERQIVSPQSTEATAAPSAKGMCRMNVFVIDLNSSIDICGEVP